MAAGVEFDEGDGFGGASNNNFASGADQPPPLHRTPQYVPGAEAPQEIPPGVMGLVMKMHLAKNPDQANKVMIGIAIASLAATGYVIFNFIL